MLKKLSPDAYLPVTRGWDLSDVNRMLGLVARLWLFCAVCTCTLTTAHGQFSCQTEPSGQARTNLVGSGQLYSY